MSLAYFDTSTMSGRTIQLPQRIPAARKLRGLLDNLTSSTASASVWAMLQDTTRVGTAVDIAGHSSVLPQVTAIEDIKRVSGFTWDQVARLFGVDRRSVHNWVNGQPMTQGHEDALYRIREVVNMIDDPNPLVVRSVMRDRTRGAAIADLLAEQRFDDAQAVALGGVVADPRASLRAPSRPLSAEERKKRSDGLTPIDLTQAVGKASLPPARLRKTTPVPRRGQHGGG